VDLGLKDRRALVLGSTRGIGRGIAEVLAAEGASVAVCGRSRSESVAAGIAERSGTTARGYALDLADSASVSALIDSVSKDFGGIDLLLLNGGGPPPGGVAGLDGAVWQAQFRPMFLSQVAIANAFLPGMRERHFGRILVTSSSGAVQPIPSLGISNTLRGALLSWAKTLSAEVAADGVTVNTVLPGRIQTERVDEIDDAAAARQSVPVEEIVRTSKAAIPMGRYGTVEEYASVAAFLLSARASYVTGAVVRIDGGYIRGV
jgi:3-oxoacyl-[acyl-carrier protein] reductase